ncbi:MAG: alpha/beta hydrolase [Anaerovoracaceae bacterium]
MTYANGNATKNVLVLHGWMHSANRYIGLAKRLSGCKVDLVDLPGFGCNKYVGKVEEVEHIHIAYLTELLVNNKYDFVIAHSWGAYILLRTVPLLDKSAKPNIILLNPVYGKNNKLKVLVPMEKFIGWIFSMQKRLPFWLIKIPTKISALLTINRWSLIDDNIVLDARRANPYIAAHLLSVMACNNWILENKSSYMKSYLIYSDKDRVIEKANIENLCTALQPTIFKVFHGVGHTLVIEKFEELAILIEQIIGGTLSDEQIS